MKRRYRSERMDSERLLRRQAVEVREPERLRERVVEGILVVDLRHRNLDDRPAPDLTEPRPHCP